jgi:hypothetical protein
MLEECYRNRLLVLVVRQLVVRHCLQQGWVQHSRQVSLILRWVGWHRQQEQGLRYWVRQWP